MKINKSITILLIILFTFKVVEAQDSLANHNRLNNLVIASATAYGLTLVLLDRLWYADFERQSFQFFNDNREWKQMDKLGHMYSAFQISKVSHRGLAWAGLEENKAIIWGTMVSCIMLTPIEIMDGFSAEYGASAGDLLANSLGGLMFFGQMKLWKEIRVHPKYSYRPSPYASLRPEVLGSNLVEEIIKDYNAHTFWLSVDLSKFNQQLPKWLNIAVGYGANNMLSANDQQNKNLGLSPTRELYLSIDFDFNEYKSRSRVLNTIIYLVNMIKLPSPTLQFVDDKIKFHTFHY